MKLITNIIKAPGEEKFKVIKKSNKMISGKWLDAVVLRTLQ